MNRLIERSGAVVRTMRAVDALDEIQDLHGRALGITTHDETAVRAAFADLSDAVCTTLGQIVATDAAAAGTLLRRAVAAARSRGADGLESILLSAFLSAIRGGLTPQVGDAAALWLTREFPDRLAGGARVVPLADAARLIIGSVSLPELSFAVKAAGGSATLLAERLRHLIEPPGDAEAQGPDDPTLEPVALASADAYIATVTAGAILKAAQLNPALAEALAGVIDANPATWDGPASQLQSGKLLALGVWSAAGAPDEQLAPVGSLPAGLAPRRRRNLAAIPSAAAGAFPSRLVPAEVTTAPPTWVSVAGRTAELHPPRALLPTPPEETSPTGGPATEFVVVRPSVPEDEPAAPVPGHPIAHPLTGELVHPGTLRPVRPPGPGPALAEATYLEANRLEVDVRTITVTELVDRLLDTR